MLLRPLVPLALLLVAVAGCGTDDETPAPTQRVAVAAPEHCNLVEQRRDVAKDPPDLGLEVRNNDLDNFSGNTGVECNERQVIYWGATPPLADQDRPEVEVRFFFTESPGAARRVFEAAPSARTTTIGDGEAQLFPDDGRYGVRFVSGATVVTVTAGCADVLAKVDLHARPCKRPFRSRSFLRQRAVDSATTIARELSGRLDA